MTDKAKNITKDDVTRLKKQWLENRDWEIEATPGYEKYHDELYNFRLYQERKASQLDNLRKKVIAASYNMPLGVYNDWQRERSIANQKKEQAHKMLSNALYGTEHVSEEQNTFIDVLLTLIIDAAAYEARSGKLVSLYTQRKIDNINNDLKTDPSESDV